jgi:hypothetical protein
MEAVKCVDNILGRVVVTPGGRTHAREVTTTSPPWWSTYGARMSWDEQSV